jgi:hypothetical protein
MDDYKLYRFSITCHTEDPAVLHCLRALCQFCEQYKKPQIGWGGTGEREWRSAGFNFTLRFTSPSFREKFIAEAERLLKGHWTVVGTDDNDPARPQRSR